MSAFAISLESPLYVKVQPIDRLVDPDGLLLSVSMLSGCFPPSTRTSSSPLYRSAAAARPGPSAVGIPGGILRRLDQQFHHLYLLELGELKPFENAVPWVGIYWR